uniref:Zinc transporter ZIP1-like n=1 Tax=Diabrotica virgifera virgifera TaxID=50390 RepID=A0A6P7F4V8_DIAVI
MCVLFLVSFIIGLLPIKLNQWFNWSSHPTTTSFVKLILGIGGGVLLCTTFIHMLPEISKNFNDLNVTPGIEVPYAELLLCAGFFMMYLIEEFVRTYMLSCKPASNSQEIIEVALKTSISRGLESARTEQQVTTSTDSYLITENTTAAIIRGLLLTLALCIHELFEGLAVGLENSPRNVWYMFAAISAHKFVISFCIGMELVISGIKTYLVIIYVFIFSFVSAAGIGIGILVSKIDNTATLVSVIMQGLAAGTLLYVVYFELLQGDKRSGLKQFGAVLLGFILMFGVSLIDILNIY